MKKEIRVWAMTTIACWLWAPNQIMAQQDSLSSTTLREVVVTATKFPKNLSETAKVLTVINEEQIARSAGKDISQLLNEQVGLVVNGANSNPGKDKSVFLRGASGSYTLILIDGIPVTDPSGVGGAYDLRMLPLEQVERIEILKGSQSTLYGTEAIAGVINIITKSKGAKPYAVNGSMAYGSFNTLRLNSTFSGSSEKLDYLIQYSRLQTDGLSEATDTTGTPGYDKDGFWQNAIQLQVALKPTSTVNIRPFFRLNDFDGRYDAGAFADDPSAVYTAQFMNYGLVTSYNYAKGKVQLLLSQSNTDRTFKDSFGEYPYDGRFTHAETFATWRLSELVSVLGGLTYQRFLMIDETASVPEPDFSLISPYVSLILSRPERYAAEVGIRYVKHDVYGSNVTFSLNPSYYLSRKFKLFANLSSGFKTPTLQQLYGPFGANPDLQPEESLTADAGIHFFSVSKNFDVRAVYFDRHIKNAIVYSGSFVYENLHTLDDKGVEIEPSVRWNKLTLSAYYAYVTGKITDDSETRSSDLLRRPRHQAGINIGYRITDNWFASINLKTFGQRNDRYFDLNTFATVPVMLEPFQLLDVYTEYAFLGNRLTLFGDFRNLLNQHYFEAYGYNTQRINVTFGARASF
jgi:vitamin B12 transporter